MDSELAGIAAVKATTAAFLIADETKLDGIEAGADVTDVTNVTAAGALMDSELAGIAAVKATTAAFLIADETKLDGIETGADVTDSANVDAAGAVMNSDASTVSMGFVIDEDNLVSNSDTKVPTQQSVKAYVDALPAGISDLDGLSDATNDTSSLFLGTNSGALDDGTANLNTGVGTDSLTKITAGVAGTAIGYAALKNVTGNFNSGVGYNSGITLTTAEYSAAVGAYSLGGASTGINNTALGGKAIQYSNPINNVAVGFSSGAYLGGLGNVSVGAYAGNGATYTTTRYCVAVGHEALKVMSNGSEYNVAVGDQAGKLVSSGTDNLFLGTDSGNTTTTGSNNVMVGSVQATSATASFELNIANCMAGDIFNGTVSFGTFTQDASAMVTIASTTSGFLPPRMTEAQRDAITSPTNGLIIFNDDSGQLNIFSTTWTALEPATPRAFTTISTDTTITNSTDRNIKVDTSGGDVTLTMPLASVGTGTFDIFKTTSDNNNVIILRAGSDTIVGQTSVSFKGNYDHYELVPDGGTLWLMK